MNAYMTSGTIDFLMKMIDEHPRLSFFIMTGDASPLIYYEHQQQNIFSAGRAYQILVKAGDIEEKGYVTMNHVPVAEESKPVFENRLTGRKDWLESLANLQALRFLKPFKGNTYILLMQWRKRADYEAFKDSNKYTTVRDLLTIKQPAYFLEQPYLTTYTMYDPEEDKE